MNMSPCTAAESEGTHEWQLFDVYWAREKDDETPPRHMAYFVCECGTEQTVQITRKVGA